MDVTKEHHEERSEPDERGMLEWEYVYDMYTFSEGEAELKFRRYVEDAGTATLMSPSKWSQLVGYQRLLAAAARHLHTREGIVSIHAYHPVRGAYAPFEDAAHSAASAGMISTEDAARLRECVRQSDAV
jgi:hypothetical protein